MGSKRRHSSSSATTKSNENSSLAEKRSVKGNGVKGEVFELPGDDLDTVEKMTVQQLRLKLRSFGIPAKGIKRDLVSSLKSFLNSKVNGEGSHVLDDRVPPEEKSISTLSNLKWMAESSSKEGHFQNINTISEVSGLKQSKRVKQDPNENSATEDETMVHATKQRLSVETDELTGKKSTRARRKVNLETSSGYIGASDKVDLFLNQDEPWTVLTHKKPQRGWIAYNPKTMRPPPLTGDVKYAKLMSWNVNGLRALLKLESVSVLQLAQREDFDVLCLQETKLQEKDVEAIRRTLLKGYDNSFWTCSVSKLGYSGAAIVSRIKPLSVRYGLGISDHDSEGRLVTVEFDHFYLISGYVPNSGDGLKRLSYRITQWDPSLSNYMKELEKSKPVILCGDLNCAYEEMDIWNPAGNRRSAGFTEEERQSFEDNFLNKGFVDTFRKQHPDVVAYTYWGYKHGARKANKGWRLDYFLASESIAEKVHDSYILPDVNGSDHSPVGLILKL